MSLGVGNGSKTPRDAVVVVSPCKLQMERKPSRAPEAERRRLAESGEGPALWALVPRVAARLRRCAPVLSPVGRGGWE